RCSAVDDGAQDGAPGEAGLPDERRARELHVEAPRNPAAGGIDAPADDARLAAGTEGPAQAHGALPPRNLHAALGRAHRGILVAMEEKFHIVSAAHLERVLDQDAARALRERDAAPVRDRIRQRAIAVV